MEVVLEALFLALSCESQCVDDVLVETLFLGLCYGSEIVDGVLLEALFLALCCGSPSVLDESLLDRITSSFISLVIF